MSKADELIQTIEGAPTPQQASELLELMHEGDTGGMPEAGLPDPGAGGESGPKVGEEGTDGSETGADTGDLTAENAVILARDGKHTISYDKLVEARESAKAAKAEAEAARLELETLRREAQARADAGVAPTAVDNQVAAAQAAIDQGVDPDIFGDFSEEDLAKGIQTLVQQQVSAQVSKALEPLKQQEAVSAEDAHYQAIYEVHPDADSIIESAEFGSWLKGQPSFTQQAISQVLNSGSSSEVVEVFSTYKQAAGLTQSGPPGADSAREAARRALNGVKDPTPVSLSDIPGGKPAGQTQSDILAAKSTGADLLDAMQGMSPDQIEDFLNKQL